MWIQRPSGEATAPRTDLSEISKLHCLSQGTRWRNRTTLPFFFDTEFILSTAPSDLSLLGYPGDQVWISGGLEIPPDTKWGWANDLHLGVRVASLTNLLAGRKIPKVTSLFAPNKRLVRARFPNGDPETVQWGYSSRDKLKYSIRADQVLEWHRPRPGQVPTFELVDFSHYKNDDIPIKNDSAQSAYNTYASGSGGVCADLWGPQADSYWCSNASSGGWAEVDKECAMTGQLQIPVGMTYNRSSEVGRRMDGWSDRTGATGGIVHAWHSQSWAMHMFEISETIVQGQFHFAKGGGKQGGRNWCRCDQCTYAGGWCGQHQDPPVQNDTRLISGTWMVENVLSELDEPGEFFFDKHSQLLYLYPNKTDSDSTGLKNLRFAMLETLIDIDGASNVVIGRLGFRDSTATYMGDWSAPSGGDWSLHRGGAVLIRNASHIMIENCTFRRLDGNAVFLSGRTRNVHIRRNTFEWLGENAVATWGHTKGFDATAQEFPMDTLIRNNVMRELGIYQKQSSAVAINKAAKTMIVCNIMFNMPRAAINFNDMVGGGDLVARNLIFNTCRESGDHGPINSWDRQAYLSNLRDGSNIFVPLHRYIIFNLIIANYGGSQGIDNDDGSSWYRVLSNVFYDADGFKMDYGGHDSWFEGNVVIAFPSKRYAPTCIGFGKFLQGHGHAVQRNYCIVPSANDQPIVQLATCNNSHANLRDNAYYSKNGKASIRCGYRQGTPLLPLSKAQELYGLELGSTVSVLPVTSTPILALALHTLFKKELPREMIA